MGQGCVIPGPAVYRKNHPLGEIAGFLLLFWQADMSAVGQSAVYSAADQGARACSGHLHVYMTKWNQGRLSVPVLLTGLCSASGIVVII